MAFDKTPTTWLPDWSEDGTDITLPIASLPQLTAEEADAATGDIRKIAFAIADKLYAAWMATASADRPSKMTLTRGTNINDQTGVIVRSYTLQFELESVAEEVADEPA
jgi:hypothetical protein